MQVKNTQNTNPEIKNTLSIEEKALKNLIEITYIYKNFGDSENTKKRVNKTIFFDFVGKKIDNLNYRQIKKYFKNNIGEIKQKFLDKINTIEKKIKNLDQNDKLYDFFKKAYEYNINMLQISLLGIPFELEKAGIKINLSFEERKKILEKQKTLEKENGMEQISQNKEYGKICYKFLVDKIEEKKDKLSEQDLKNFDKYLKIIKEKIGEDFEYSGKKNTKKEENKVKEFVEEIKKVKIPREDVIKLFELAFKVNGINKKVIESDVDYIYDGPDGLEYPRKKSFDYLLAHRVFALIDHEIEKHFFNDKVHIILFGKNAERGHGNLVKEEGLAITGEKILLGEKIEDISIISTFVKTYFGEFLSGKELLDFLKLSKKIVPEKDVIGRFFRLKRGKDLELPGVQEKDALYTIGLLKTIEFIKNGKDLKDLFLGKISFEDIDKIKNKKNITENIHLPVGVAEILMFKFLQKFYGKNKFNNFEEYIKGKYGNIDKTFFQELKKEQLKIISEMHKILGHHIKTPN